MMERRGIVRKDCSLHGEIFVTNIASIPCMVRNVSVRGAKLVAADVSGLPPKFRLRATELGLDTQVSLVWREGDEMGVRFPLDLDHLR